MLRVFLHNATKTCVVTSSFYPGQIIGKSIDLDLITKKSIDPSVQVVNNTLIATKHLKKGEEISKPLNRPAIFDTTINSSPSFQKIFYP
jgi:hypothetical protein